MKRPTPAIATHASAQPMPRWLVLLLCAAYVVPGYVGRDAWKSADIAAFGVMQAMAQGKTSWWTPEILGLSADTVAWLPYWLGALCMSVLTGYPELASRLPYALALVLTLYFTWKSVYHLALLPAAQPVTFAFGGQAEPTAYARALADAGLLAVLACLGLAQLSHEASPQVFQTAAVASLLYSSALIAHRNQQRWTIAMASWLGLAALALSGQPMLAAAVACIQAAQHAGINQHRTGTGARAHTHTPSALWIGSLLIGTGIFWFALTNGPSWQPQLPESSPEWWSLLKLLTWFTWPVWPLAYWTLWRWRHHVHQPHLALPLVLLGATLLNGMLQTDSSRLLMLSLPALSVLAAFSMPTLSRSVGALIDWFSVLFFSACATVIWVVWFAMHTGIPARPAANVVKLAPDFSPHFSAVAFATAAAATLIWYAGVAWRVGRHPPYLWKSLMLPAGGSVLCWLLLMTLWLPLLDHGRSYRTLAERLAARMDPDQCAYAPDLSLAQTVGLMHYGALDLERLTDQRTCSYLILSDRDEQNTPDSHGPGWLLQARFNRLNERQEGLKLFTRVSAPASLPFAPVPAPEPDQVGTTR